jgi:transcriptional regulator with XRE-family HTH domain
MKRHKQLGALIKRERRIRDLRQVDVARKLGRHRSWIARSENGQQRVDVIEFLEIAKVIGFDACEVLRKLDRNSSNRTT